MILEEVNVIHGIAWLGLPCLRDMVKLVAGQVACAS